MTYVTDQDVFGPNTKRQEFPAPTILPSIRLISAIVSVDSSCFRVCDGSCVLRYVCHVININMYMSCYKY